MNKNRALLLDRDGVINVDTRYVGSVARFDFMPGVFSLLRAAQDKGFRLAVLTNQSGVARGLYSESDHDAVTEHMLAEFRREYIEVALTLVCFAHPEGTVAAHAHESFWRKPNSGMVLEAIRRMDLDPVRSAFLGDNLRDMQAALGGGIGHCWWLTQETVVVPTGVSVMRSFAEVVTALSA
jgi:D-glycero-D-manno-heptose 1,7-bisphosphate phosphatase